MMMPDSEALITMLIKTHNVAFPLHYYAIVAMQCTAYRRSIGMTDDHAVCLRTAPQREGIYILIQHWLSTQDGPPCFSAVPRREPLEYPGRPRPSGAGSY